MAEDRGSIDLNSDKNSDFEGFNSDNIGDRESIVPDSEPGTSDIEISSVRSSDLFDVGEEEDKNAEIDDGGGVGDVNPIRTSNFSDITIHPFLDESGPALPDNFDVATASPLAYFDLLFKQVYQKVHKQLCII